jgi:predicted dehydrogenase
MKKLRIIVLGLGNFGHSWACEVLPQLVDLVELVAVVDRNEETFVGITDSIPKFKRLQEAIDQTMPDAVINVTPPQLHTSINKNLLSQNIAVLCEKPISDTLADAQEMSDFVIKHPALFMISENYRYKTVFRKCRQWIESGKIGKIHSIQCHFAHFHADYSMYYHGNLKHPLLTDVTVHHLDLARFLSGAEAEKIYCKEWSAPYSWYQERPANAMIWTDMTSGIHFQYSGSLASPVSTTDWYGNWEIEGNKGTIRLNGEQLTCELENESEIECITVPSDVEDTRVNVLKEFVNAFWENRPGETNIDDNFKTFLWLEAAIASSEQEKVIQMKYFKEL